MKNLERRVEKLEECLVVKSGPRDVEADVLLSSVNFGKGEPIFPGVWATVLRGGTLTDEEIERLRAEWERERRFP